MAGGSPVRAGEEQVAALQALAASREGGEAGRARAGLLTVAGWTSPRIAEAFGVREEPVRLWRSAFARGGGHSAHGARGRKAGATQGAGRAAGGGAFAAGSRGRPPELDVGAGAGARSGQDGRQDGSTRPRRSQAHRADQHDQAQHRLHRTPAQARRARRRAPG